MRLATRYSLLCSSASSCNSSQLSLQDKSVSGLPLIVSGLISSRQRRRRHSWPFNVKLAANSDFVLCSAFHTPFMTPQQVVKTFMEGGSCQMTELFKTLVIIINALADPAHISAKPGVIS